MRTRTLAHLRHNAVAYLALFVALGGTSYAAIKLPANSVGAKQLRKNAVTPSKIHPKTKALLQGQRGATGPAGPTGPAGAAGAPGATGAPGPTASGFATATAFVGLTTTNQPIMNLGATPDATHSGPLTVGFAARIVAQASLALFKPTFNATVAGQAFCRLELGTLGVYTPLGMPTQTTFEATTADQVVYRQIPVTAAVDVAPGTYDVRVVCSRRDLPGPPALNAPLSTSSADLTVVAVAR